MQPSMELFVATTALLMGLATGMPAADKDVIKIPRPGELSSRLAARYVSVLGRTNERLRNQVAKKLNTQQKC